MPDRVARPKVAVFYDAGAASPLDIVSESAPCCDIVFVFDAASEHGREIKALMHRLPAEVVEIDGRDGRDMATDLRQRGVSGVTTFAEGMLDITADVADNGHFPFHSPDTAVRLRSKIRQREALNLAGVSPTRFVALPKGFSGADLEAAVRAIGLPAVAKPEYGMASRDTYLIDTEDSLSSVRTTLDGSREAYIVEERIVGVPHPAHDWLADYVSVEVLAQGGEYSLLTVTDKPPLCAPLRETGALMPSTLAPTLKVDLFAMCEAALRALGCEIGVFHCELKLTASGPRVIEINGRLGGPVNALLRKVSHLRPLTMALELALGNPVSFQSRFHQYALQSDVVARLGVTQVLSMPRGREIREIAGVYRTAAFVTPPAEVRPRAGEAGKILSAWIAHEDIAVVQAALAEFEDLCTRTLRYT